MTLALAPQAPVAIGPTWQRDEAGRFVLPEHTLGWQILQWTADYLLQPDGPEAGEPWRFTDEQARFLLWWYAVNEQGRFIYRYGTYRRMKGHGKDPLAAVLSCVEFVGPCRFKEWHEGEPVAQDHYAAWIQIAAVSRDQTRNTLTLFPGTLSPRAIEEYGIDLGKEIIYAEKTRKRIEAVTSSPRSLEGGRATFTIKNETHHWRQANEGHEMAKVIARNAAKSRDGSSRVLAITNAHAPGEDSDAEHDYEAWQLGGTADMLYDSLEAPETDLADDESVMAGILAARGDSFWVHPERLLAEIRDPRTSPAMAYRFYLNKIHAEEDKPFSSERWGELVNGWRLLMDKVEPAEGRKIALGFDGSENRDHTALIGTDIATGYQWVAGYWEPEPLPNGDVRINTEDVDQVMQDLFSRFAVWRLYADPYKWSRYLAKWSSDFGEDHVVSWSTTQYKKMAFSLKEYRTAMDAGHVSHDGDARFAASIANSHKHMQNYYDDDGERMWTIQKERMDSPLKIDAAMAGCLSWQAREDAVADGVLGTTEAGVFFV